jgi:hypothetical protein
MPTNNQGKNTMNNIAHLFDKTVVSEAAVRVTTVTGRADDWFFVQDLSVQRVKRAASCVIEPEVGDLVMLCEAPHEHCSFILSVLVKSNSDAGRLCLPGGVTLQTEGKQLTVQADGIILRGRETIGLSTVHLDVNAAVATTRVGHLQTWAETIETTVDRVTLFAKTFTQKLDRMITRVRESWRKVEGLDETQAARIRVHVEGAHQLNAEHVTVSAEGFVRIDGKTINLG